MTLSRILTCAVLASFVAAPLATTAHADDAMMKKDDMTKDGTEKKDGMKKNADTMMKKDSMMKGDTEHKDSPEQ